MLDDFSNLLGLDLSALLSFLITMVKHLSTFPIGFSHKSTVGVIR